MNANPRPNAACPCEHLRTLDNRAPDLASDRFLVYRHPYVQYFCEKTLQAYGPDDAPASPEDCGRTRACYVPWSRGVRT